MTQFVGAQHEFHDARFVNDWADRFLPTPSRLALFDIIYDQVRRLGIAEPRVLELGIGPGFMARHMLERDKSLSYEGLDFSEVFFDVASRTLGPLAERVDLTHADLTDAKWPERLVRPPQAIISTWALHDLGSELAIADVYQRCFAVLPEGGVLVNGDFIKPEGIDIAFEVGRLEVERHLDLLLAAGFTSARCLGHFDEELVQPTAAHNYACLMAMK